jgi:hypothetical protein
MFGSILKIGMNDKQALRSVIQLAFFYDRWSMSSEESGSTLVEVNAELKFDCFAFIGRS